MMLDRDPTFPNALEAVFLVIALFAVEYVLGAAFYDASRAWHIDMRNAGGVITVLGNGVLFTGLLYYKRMSYGQLFHSGRHSVLATVCMLGLPILLLVPALNMTMELLYGLLVWMFPMSAWQQARFDDMASRSLAALVSACILAPVLEEMLFRGIILRSFLRQYRPRKAILLSALLFGLAHLNVYQFVVASLLGLLLGWLYERSRSLWPCILLHASYNASIVLSLENQDTGVFGADSGWAMRLLCGIIGAGLLRTLLSTRLMR
jgi:CAAX protease family protein